MQPFGAELGLNGRSDGKGRPPKMTMAAAWATVDLSPLVTSVADGD